MSKGKKLLDLFCCAGGAATGYYRTGFTEILGIDINPQHNYPFSFIQMDAIEACQKYYKEFDLIHASPPCQNYSVSTIPHRVKGKIYADFLEQTRNLLIQTNKPYIIENVMNAPMQNYVIKLCGTQFNKRFFRHRLFETNLLIQKLPHGKHRSTIKDGYYLTIVGHGDVSRDCRLSTWREVMEMPWLPKAEIVEAVPPCYTEYLGNQAFYMV